MTNEQTKQKPHPYSQVLQWVAEGKEIEAFTGAQWITAVTSGILNAANHFGHPEYYQPQDFRLKPERHIHQNLIDAFENGAEIEMFFDEEQGWLTATPQWATNRKYRIKPKDDTAQYAYVVLQENGSLDISHWTKNPTCIDNLKVVFDGETNKIKSVEIIDKKHD